MKPSVALLAVLLIGLQSVQAQEATPAPGRNKAVYVEGLGSGVLLSANYDFRFKPTQDGLGLRVGVGGGAFADQNSDARVGLVTVPLMVNYLVGKRRVAFEMGAGLTPIYINASGTNQATGDFLSGNGFGAFGSLNLGLRLQPIRNGAVFRLNWAPTVSNTGFYPSWFGVSLGFAFK